MMNEWLIKRLTLILRSPEPPSLRGVRNILCSNSSRMAEAGAGSINLWYDTGPRSRGHDCILKSSIISSGVFWISTEVHMNWPNCNALRMCLCKIALEIISSRIFWEYHRMDTELLVHIYLFYKHINGTMNPI